MGRIKQKARLNPGIHPRTVAVQHGWWYPEMPPEEPFLFGVFMSKCNVLIDDDPEILDPLTGGWNLRGLRCKIYKEKSPNF